MTRAHSLVFPLLFALFAVCAPRAGQADIIDDFVNGVGDAFSGLRDTIITKPGDWLEEKIGIDLDWADDVAHIVSVPFREFCKPLKCVVADTAPQAPDARLFFRASDGRLLRSEIDSSGRHALAESLPAHYATRDATRTLGDKFDDTLIAALLETSFDAAPTAVRPHIVLSRGAPHAGIAGFGPQFGTVTLPSQAGRDALFAVFRAADRTARSEFAKVGLVFEKGELLYSFDANKAIAHDPDAGRLTLGPFSVPGNNAAMALAKGLECDDFGWVCAPKGQLCPKGQPPDPEALCVAAFWKE